LQRADRKGVFILAEAHLQSVACGVSAALVGGRGARRQSWRCNNRAKYLKTPTDLALGDGLEVVSVKNREY